MIGAKKRRKLLRQMLKDEKAAARARLFLRTSLIVEAFCLPVIALIAFMFLASNGVLAVIFPWGHAVFLFVLSFWFFYKLSYVQDRLAHGRAFVASKNLNENDLDLYEKQRLLLIREWKKWPSFLAHETDLGVRRFMPHASGALVFCVVSAWFFYGGELLAKINPFFDQAWLRETQGLTVWISPPDFMGQSPLIVAAPGGAYETQPTLDVREGSVLSVRASGDGAVPVLQANGTMYPLERDEHGDYSAQVVLKRGVSIAVSQGWKSLGFWHIRIKADSVPVVKFAMPPEISQQKTVRVAFKATDDLAVKKIILVVRPSTAPTGLKNDTLEIPFSVPEVSRIEETIYTDLTSSLAAGLPSVLQLKAIDAAGHEAWSDKVSLVLPERTFTNPLAQALAEERKQLLINANSKQRDEAAAVMAGIARQKSFYNADPVVLLALRSGAMRLLFDASDEAFSSVASSLWRVAVRIEEGEMGVKRESLRKQLTDLSAALDEGRKNADIERKIDEITIALSRFLDEMAADMGRRNKEDKGATLQLAYENQTLTVGDLLRVLQGMRLSAHAENWEQVRVELTQLQRILENVQPKAKHLSEEQRKVLRLFRSLKSVVDSQKEIQSDTIRAARLGRNTDAEKKLAAKQDRIGLHLQKLLETSTISTIKLQAAVVAMRDVSLRIPKEGARAVLLRQDEIVNMLSQSLVSLLNGLPDGMAAMPRHILGKNGDEDQRKLNP